MAGRKHHHVPQFLQRRFGAQSNKATQVVVYSKDKPPFKTSTANFGAERDFYANGDDFFVDDLITKYEDDIQSLFYKLELGDNATLADTITISELIAHLELRSAFLRSQLFEISGLLSSFLETLFGSEATLVEALDRHVRANPDILRELIIENTGVDAPIEALAQFIEPQLKAVFSQNGPTLIRQFAGQLAGMRGAFAASVKSSHLNILRKEASEVERTRFYRDFTYSIQSAQVGSFILPDTMVAFCSKRKVSPFCQKDSKIIEVILPISSSVVLLGRKNGARSRSVMELNNLLASTSFQSFVAIKDDPVFQKISSKIGKNASIFGKDEANRIFNDFLSDFSGRRKRKKR